MNTNFEQTQKNIDAAINYYRCMLAKDFEGMEAYLHPEVALTSPLSTISGKEVVVEAAQSLTDILKDIVFRSKLGANNQVMLAYNFILTEPIGMLRAAVLIHFKDELIYSIELFFDSKPFEQK